MHISYLYPLLTILDWRVLIYNCCLTYFLECLCNAWYPHTNLLNAHDCSIIVQYKLITSLMNDIS
jgi:hypothetical protein